MTPEKQAADLVGLATGQDRNEAMTHKPMTDASGPQVAQKAKSLDDLLRYYEPAICSDITRVLESFTANGELRDYDDELANRVEDAKTLVELVPLIQDRLGEVALTDDALTAALLRSLDQTYAAANEQLMAADLIRRLSSRCAALEGERDEANELADACRKNLAHIASPEGVFGKALLAAEAKLVASEAALAEALRGLGKLAMLGGGRSDGNFIARQTLAKLAALSPQSKTEGTK